MQIVVIYNPRAGRGRGESAAMEVQQALIAAGHNVSMELAGPAPAGRPEEHARPDLVVIVGGDGTLHYAIGRLVPRRAAVYHFPLGTENLFAREFGMRAEAARLVRAVSAWRLKDVDIGTCNGRRFALMASVGADAGVIRRLTAARQGAIRHHHYVGPVVAELLKPTLPRLSITVDGKSLVVGRLGMVVVANSRQYALRINPARHADMADGLLEVVFLPASTSLGLLARVVGARLRCPGPGVVRGRGQRIRVQAEGLALCSQIDGEAGPAASIGGMDLDFGVEQAALRVLLGV
ncbi:MAG: hypothetical protein IT436_02975 [Phycisphaerales bacterium]|nr:hypothetical protein [Phycisphaerales bacterium]